MSENNTVAIGNKPVVRYVYSAMRVLKTQPSVFIIARGKNISKAVDVALFLVERQNLNVSLTGISVNTATLQREENGKIVSKRVSEIRLTVSS